MGSDFDNRIIAITEALDHVEAARNMLRCATHRLVSAGLHGAKDIAAHGLYELHKVHDILSAQKQDLLAAERLVEQSLRDSDHLQSSERSPQLGSLPTSPISDEPQAAVNLGGSARRRGLRGIEVVPGRVKLGRLEAGLSLGQVADGQVSRAAISLIEHGKTRPSLKTLELIAARTNRPLEWFTDTQPERGI